MEAGTLSVLHVASWQAIFQSDSYPSLRWNPSSECFQSRRATEKVQRSSWSIGRITRTLHAGWVRMRMHASRHPSL